MDGFGLITGVLAYFAYCKCLEPVFVFCKIICLMLFKEMTSNEVHVSACKFTSQRTLAKKETRIQRASEPTWIEWRTLSAEAYSIIFR